MWRELGREGPDLPQGPQGRLCFAWSTTRFTAGPGSRVATVPEYVQKGEKTGSCHRVTLLQRCTKYSSYSFLDIATNSSHSETLVWYGCNRVGTYQKPFQPAVKTFKCTRAYLGRLPRRGKAVLSPFWLPGTSKTAPGAGTTASMKLERR